MDVKKKLFLIAMLSIALFLLQSGTSRAYREQKYHHYIKPTPPIESFAFGNTTSVKEQ